MLTTLLGSSLKFDGRFLLQTQTDGPVSFLIVDFQAPDRLRAYARFDATRPKGRPEFRRAVGQGSSRHDYRPGGRHQRYPGLVALEGGGWKTPPTNIFCARNRFRPGWGLRSARNGAAAAEAQGIAGAPAACCCSFSEIAGTGAARRPASRRRARGQPHPHGGGRRRLGRRPVADFDGRGYRADRSGFVGRAVIVPLVPRARRAGVCPAAPCARNAPARARPSPRC